MKRKRGQAAGKAPENKKPKPGDQQDAGRQKDAGMKTRGPGKGLGKGLGKAAAGKKNPKPGDQHDAKRHESPPPPIDEKLYEIDEILETGIDYGAISSGSISNHSISTSSMDTPARPMPPDFQKMLRKYRNRRYLDKATEQYYLNLRSTNPLKGPDERDRMMPMMEDIYSEDVDFVEDLNFFENANNALKERGEKVGETGRRWRPVKLLGEGGYGTVVLWECTLEKLGVPP